MVSTSLMQRLMSVDVRSKLADSSHTFSCSICAVLLVASCAGIHPQISAYNVVGLIKNNDSSLNINIVHLSCLHNDKGTISKKLFANQRISYS